MIDLALRGRRLGEGAKYMHSSVLGRRCKVHAFISAWEKVQSRTIHQCLGEGAK